MSSVLKALKKLEQSPAAAGAMSTGAATVIMARDTQPGWLRRWGWPVGLGLAVGLAVPGAGLLLRSRPPQPGAPAVALVQSITAPSVPAAPLSAKPPPAAEASSAAGPLPPPSVIPTAPTEGARPPRPDPSPAAEPARDEAAAAPPTTAATVGGADPPDERFPRLADDRLALQAIAWSDAAERRMAVINGDILREGSAVAGFTIRRIRRDDVLVAAQGRTFRLVFRNRE